MNLNSNEIDFREAFEQMADFFSNALQNHEERINALENEVLKNNSQIKSIQNALDAIEKRNNNSDECDIELDYSCQYEQAMEKIKSVEQIVKVAAPIHYAICTYGDKKMIPEMKETVKKQQKAEAKSPMGNIFLKALCNNDLQSVVAICPFVDINDKYKDENTALHYAIQNKNKNILRFLLNQGAEFDNKEIEAAPSEFQEILRLEQEKRKQEAASSVCSFNYKTSGSIPFSLNKDGIPDMRLISSNFNSYMSQNTPVFQSTSSNDFGLCSNSTLHYKKDGTLDMRYKSSRDYLAKNNNSDMRYTQHISSSYGSTIHLKKDGTPDMRYKSSKRLYSK